MAQKYGLSFVMMPIESIGAPADECRINCESWDIDGEFLVMSNAYDLEFNDNKTRMPAILTPAHRIQTVTVKTIKEL